MMSQFTFAAVVVPVEVGAGLADAPAEAEPLTDGLAVAPRADWSIFVALLPETAITIPSVSPSAIGMARGTAIRAVRLCRIRRRHADRCPVRIRSTSMSALTPRWITLNRPGERNQEIENIYTLSRFTPLSCRKILPRHNAADHGVAASLIFIRDRTAWLPDRPGALVSHAL